MKVSSTASQAAGFKPITVTLTVTFETEAEWETAQRLAQRAEDNSVEIDGFTVAEDVLIAEMLSHMLFTLR